MTFHCTPRRPWWRRPWRRRVALATAALAAGALAAGVPPAASAQPSVAASPGAVAPPSPAVAGSELDVYVMTMGQGDLLWERFGHNAIGIRDRSTGTDLVYNWGMFSFDQPGFLPRFLRGEMLYWMAPFDAVQTLVAYQMANRSVTIQWLNLSPAQKDSLRRVVEWNARDENKFYRYDYYRDNCSTRVRDALDLVLGGAIRRATEPQPTAMTYRDHSLRLMDGMFWTRTGIDLGLGAPTDRPITAWEAMFIPMEVQRRLRDVRIPDASGAMVPLVASEDVLFQATRTPERMDVPRPARGALVAGVLAAAAMLALGYRTRGRFAATALAMAWAVAAGFFGLLLLLLWIATQHVATHGNQNLFFTQPLWLGVAALIPLARSGRRARDRLLLLVRLSVALAVTGGILALTPLGQPSGAIAAFAVPVCLAAYLLVLRVVYLAQQAAAAAEWPSAGPRNRA